MSYWPFLATSIALAAILVVRKLRDPVPMIVLPLATGTIFVCGWQVACELMRYELKLADGTVRLIEVFPTPWQTVLGMIQPVKDGTLLRFAVASIYRVAVGFTLAARRPPGSGEG